ncbi:DUF6529 family protein [Promicromonospora sp. CA-289599]|uniref:DUF6529 family protein n=1 Tax=Promicromonospora sp. CA-289599 TaxID=3240014 RepID=UPI003D8D136A
MNQVSEAGTPSRGVPLLLVPFLVGAVVSVVLGVYANVHAPTGVAVNVAGFSGPLEAKVWLTSAALLLAVVQVVSALTMYGKIGRSDPPTWIGAVHRWSGRAAFLLTIPVAVHCLYALGFQTATPRVLIHSAAGTLFFGAFTVKMLGLRLNGLPGWALPVLGGALFTLLVALWWTSSLWFFTTFGVRI